MDRITHGMRMDNWKKIISECNASGLPKKRWCEQNNVSEKSFYYWQRQIRQEVFGLHKDSQTSALTQAFVEIPTTVPADTVVQSTENCVAATIRIKSCVIEVSESASDSFLHRLFGAFTYVQ